MEELWGDRLKLLDCSPTPTCSLQLASGLWDAFYAAGGLSLPGILQSGLAIVYSSSRTNPRPNFVIPKGKELNFVWECLRFIPPVYGFPHWEPRPACVGLSVEQTLALNKSQGQTAACPEQSVDANTGFPPVNQWCNGPDGRPCGKRVLLMLAAAQHDPKVWGPTADEFVLRPLADYNNYSVGFAEMAEDSRINNGLSDRSCPGKDLALKVGQIFWEEFDVSAWTPVDSDIAIDPDDPLVQIPSFALKPVGHAVSSTQPVRVGSAVGLFLTYSIIVNLATSCKIARDCASVTDH